MGERGFGVQVLTRRRLGKGWEAIQREGTPGRTVSSRGTEASTRNRRPGWCWT